MKVGDLVMYMGHLGIILEPVGDCAEHWKVYFFAVGAYITIYEPLMAKFKTDKK